MEAILVFQFFITVTSYKFQGNLRKIIGVLGWLNGSRTSISELFVDVLC